MALTKHIVSRDDSIYEAWPDLAITNSGKLICVFTECEHHLNRDNSRIVMRFSTDRGRTWSEKIALTERGTKEDYFNNARISRLSDGRMVIVCDRVFKDENKEAKIYLWYGDEEGEHWSEPEEKSFCGIVPTKLTELKNGRWILGAHFVGQARRLCQYLWYSDDKGKTWSDRVTVAADCRYHLCEGSILECENNTLVCFLRENSGMGIDMQKAISYDNGETWTPVFPTRIGSGHRPVAGFLQDGRVMCTYRYIPCNTQNVFAAFLSENAVLKTDFLSHNIRVFPLDYDRNPRPDLGYTGWVQFDDGEIYVVNYIKDDRDKAQIRGYSFTPEDVMLPETKTATPKVW